MYSVFIKKVSVLLVCVWCILAPVKASADTPYNNYTYTDEKAVESPAAVIPESVVTGSDMGTGDLNNPMDLFIDRKGFIYIADTNNNRVLKIDSEYKLIHEYSEFINNGGEDSLLSPQGLFVDLDGNLLVADTGNQRLVKFNGNGEMIMVMQAPTSPILTDNFEYKPVKVASDIAGRIFVISKDYNRGLLELDAKGDFVQLLSAAKVTFSVTELLWRFFSTQEQLDRMASFVPTEYNNLYVDEEGFIYVTNGSITGDTPKKNYSGQKA